MLKETIMIFIPSREIELRMLGDPGTGKYEVWYNERRICLTSNFERALSQFNLFCEKLWAPMGISKGEGPEFPKPSGQGFKPF